MRRRINRLNGGGRIVYFDSLAGLDGENVANRPIDSGGRWRAVGSTSSVIFDSGLAKADAVVGGGLFVGGGRLRRANGRVAIDFVRVGATQGTAVGVLFRVRAPGVATQSGPFYDIVHNQASNIWQFVRSNATVAATQVSQTLILNQHYRLEVDFRKNRFRVYLDGALLKDFEDVQTIRGLLSGIFFQNSAGTASNMRLGNWMASR